MEFGSGSAEDRCVKSASGENGQNSGINQAQNDSLVGVAEVVSAQNGLHLTKEQLNFPSRSIESGGLARTNGFAAQVCQIEPPLTFKVTDAK